MAAPAPAGARYTLFGIVSESGTAKPVVGATVTIGDGANAGRRIDTDGNGYYSLGQLQPGPVNLQVAKSGFTTIARAITLSADTRLDVPLVAIAPPPTPPPPPSPPPSSGTTSLAFTSDAGDYIGQGRSYMYGLADGSWNVRGDSGDSRTTNHIYISMTNFLTSPSNWWYLDFKAPNNEPPAVGTYLNARRYPFQGSQPGFNLSGNGRGCNTLTATFTIQELVLGPGNSIDRLRATFEQHCEGASPALKGEVSIANNPWR